MDEKPRLKKAGQLDGRAVIVDFAPEAREAFRDLAAALHFSQQVTPETLSIIHDWGEGQKPSVAGVVVALPAIADATFKHIQATGDKRAKGAWDEINRVLINHETHGFVMENHRTRGR